jgi:parallel beta-helix repeat protein
MKKQYGALTVLLILLSSSSFILLGSMPPVKATYVEGTISQDTVWFLVDSPFVLSGNVTVNPGVTLTIEPGAQVRFGGFFSLNVNGRIVADGTSERKIRFTTNDPADSIMWQTVRINGNQPSSLTNCQIDHGTDGLTIDNGYTEMQDSSVTACSQNGIVVNSGSILVAGVILASNNMAAIRINGGSQVTINNNTVASNQFGIVLSGSLLGDISISQNTITNNTDSGIVLESDVYTNTIITRNTVSSNGNGILVQNNTSPDIAYNYILNNTVGLQYQLGDNHQAHFNDLSNNKLGMDASSNATVDATYNYWGDKSGPFHPSMNPDGKGNAVNVDGTNVDFIFFLSMPFDHVNQRPVADIWTDKSLVTPNQVVTFIGTDSHDEGRVDQYFFDFGDGTNTGWTTLSLFNHTYSSPGVYYATLLVTDDFNAISQSAPLTPITVQDLTPLTMSLTADSETVDFNGNVSLKVYASNGYGPVENATVTLFSVNGGAFSPTSGLTDSAGYFETVFTAPNVTELTNVRMIARASKVGYADGSDFRYLKVLAPLNVRIDPEPSIVSSEGNVTVAVHVEESSGRPVSNATVTISSDVGGNFSAELATTDSNGTAEFIFTAPQTMSAEGINATLAAKASTSGWADGEGSIIVPVKPKVLFTQVFLPTDTAYSEQRMNITVNVTYDNSPIQDATIILTSESGNFTSSAPTDADGNATVEFVALRVNDSTNSTITATPNKVGYFCSPCQVSIVVNPRTFRIAIVSPFVTAGETVDVKVEAECVEDGSKVEDANVLFSLSSGETMTGTTDAEGTCFFTLTSRETSTQALNVTADVTKSGYTPGRQLLSVPISQPAGGFPLLTMILIILPIVIVVIVAVLIKLKVIQVSAKEETSA